MFQSTFFMDNWKHTDRLAPFSAAYAMCTTKIHIRTYQHRDFAFYKACGFRVQHHGQVQVSRYVAMRGGELLCTVVSLPYFSQFESRLFSAATQCALDIRTCQHRVFVFYKARGFRVSFLLVRPKPVPHNRSSGSSLPAARSLNPKLPRAPSILEPPRSPKGHF